MIHVIETSGLTLHISPCPGSRRVAYILYPMEALGGMACAGCDQIQNLDGEHNGYGLGQRPESVASAG